MSDKIQRIAAEKSASTPSIAPVAKPAPKRAAAGEAAADLASPVNAPALPGYSLSQIGIHYGAPAPIQAKLTVGPVNDHYEQEADSVAQRVVEQINAPVAQRQELPKEDEEKVQTKPVISAIQRQEMPKEEEDKLQTKSLVASIQRAEMPKDDEEKVQTKPLASTIQRQEQPDDEEKLQTKPQSNVLQRQETPEDEEKVQTKSLMGTVQRQETPEDEDKLQTKAADNALQRQADQDDETLQSKPQIQRRADGSMAATPALESAIQQSRGSGQSLSASTRQPMEQAFGADFSKVKVHTDAQADQLNRSIQARAFTTGQDIYFRQGEHSPGTRAGQELLAHELTHVVQQGGSNKSQIQPQLNISLSAVSIQRTIGDGHDLDSPRFSRLLDLEAAYDGETVLSEGSSGRGVQAIQHALYDLGFTLPNFGADGTFGSETKAAVKAFQKANPPLVDDGKVGKNTITILNKRFSTPVLPAPSVRSALWTQAGVCSILCPWSPHTINVLKTRITLKSFDSISWADERWDGTGWVPDPFPGGGYNTGTEIGVKNSSCERMAETLYHEVLHAEQPKSHSTTLQKESYAYRIGEEFSIAMGLGGRPSLRSTDTQGRQFADRTKIGTFLAPGGAASYPGVPTGGGNDQIIDKATILGNVRVQRPDGSIYTRPAAVGEKVPGPMNTVNEVIHPPTGWVCP